MASKLASGLAAGAAAACAGRPVPPARTSPDPLPAPAFRLPAVNVSRDRVIRTVVGLRPYRPSGFRVQRQDLGGGRLLVHNYGHGGAGVTLSWGTSWLAVEELLGENPPPSRAAVIGCGAVGLATARLLQRRGVDVTIYTKDLPPNTTSNVACAQWGPYSVSDARVHTDAFQDRLERAARISQRIFQDLVGVRYGVRWLPNYPLSDVPFGGPDQPDRLADLFPDARDLEPGTHPFPVRHARQYTTMMIEPPVYLGAVMQDFQLAGGRIRVRDFGSLDEIAGLPERRVVNCTGIGARELVGDEELTPLNSCGEGPAHKVREEYRVISPAARDPLHRAVPGALHDAPGGRHPARRNPGSGRVVPRTEPGSRGAHPERPCRLLWPHGGVSTPFLKVTPADPVRRSRAKFGGSDPACRFRFSFLNSLRHDRGTGHLARKRYNSV